MTVQNLSATSALNVLGRTGTTNLIRNSTMQGAFVCADSIELLTNPSLASPGTGWTVTSGVVFNGASTTITGTGVNYNNYISQQLTGLTPGRSYVASIGGLSVGFRIFVGTAAGDGTYLTLDAAGNGDNIATPDRGAFTAPAGGSVWVTYARFGASAALITSVSVQDGERVQNGGFTSSPINATANTVQNGWLWNHAAGVVVPSYSTNSVSWTGDGSNWVAIGQAIPTVAGATYTMTVTVSGPGNINMQAGTLSLTTNLMNIPVAAGTRVGQFTAVGSTTYISLSSTFTDTTAHTVSSVSVQSAGKLPTNWSSSFANFGSLLRTVTQVGVENGIDEVEITISGTSGTASSFNVVPELSTGASVGQKFVLSAYAKLVSGTMPGLFFYLDEWTAGNGFNTGHQLGFVTPTAASINNQRGSFPLTVAGGASITLSVAPSFAIFFTNTTAYSFSFRLGCPMLQQVPAATPLIKTYGTTVDVPFYMASSLAALANATAAAKTGLRIGLSALGQAMGFGNTGATNFVRNSSSQAAIPRADNVQLLTNPTFAGGSGSACPGWTVFVGTGGAVSFNGTSASINGNNTVASYIAQQITGLTPGRDYIITLTGVFTATVSVGSAAGDTSVLNQANIVGLGAGVTTVMDRVGFTATSSSHWVTFARTSSSAGTWTAFSVSDGERIQNGGFTANPINAAPSTVQNGWQWTSAGATFSFTSNTIQWTPDGTNGMVIGTSFPVLNGRAYNVTFDMLQNAANVQAGSTFGSVGSYNTISGVGAGQTITINASFTGTMYLTFNTTTAVPRTLANVSVKSGGSGPQFWAFGVATSVNKQIVATGIDPVIGAYTDYRVFGTTVDGSLAINLGFDTSGLVLIAQGQRITISSILSIVGGTQPGGMQYALDEQTPAGVHTAYTTSTAFGTLTATPTTFTRTLTISNAATGKMGFGIWLGQPGSGSVIDFTMRVAQPSLQRAAIAPPYIRTTNAAISIPFFMGTALAALSAARTKASTGLGIGLSAIAKAVSSSKALSGGRTALTGRAKTASSAKAGVVGTALFSGNVRATFKAVLTTPKMAAGIFARTIVYLKTKGKLLKSPVPRSANATAAARSSVNESASRSNTNSASVRTYP